MQPFLLALAIVQSPAPSQAGIPADSYADSATAALVARTRGARERNERLVTAYTATVSQRVGAGIRALSRDRMLFRQELSATIAWKRDGPSTITVTGARQAVPVATGKDHLPRNLDGAFRWLVVNPAEDYLGMIGDDDDDGFVYPLMEGGELDYRYAIGDTTVITLATGKRIRLLQLKISPRRSDWKLMSGALWFDADTYGLVRAVFRPARPYELRRDGDKDDMDDVPSWVNATAEIKFITLEYGLYENRWWMLRYAALDAIGNMGSWLGVPVKFERTYSDYEVEGGTPPAEGSTYRPAGTVRDRARDTMPPDPEADRTRRATRRRARNDCLDKAENRDQVRECWRAGRPQDSTLVVFVPTDTLALISSETLGPPVLEMGDLITESELRGMADAIRQMPGVPRQDRIELPHRLNALLRNARYNRVEGLSLGLSGTAQRGGLVVDGLGRIGIADGVPNGELGVSVGGQHHRFRLGGYRRLAAMNPDTKPFGVVNSVWGVIAQRDDGDYFRTLGIELTGQSIETGWWSWRLYAERQQAAFVETSFSLPHLFDSEQQFRPNSAADRADQFGAALTVRGSQPLSRSVHVGGEASIEAAGGAYEFGRGSATVRALLTPGGPLALAVEASAGTSTGSVPVQGRFYLGGPATLRGYSGAVTAGEAFWRGRVEVANAFPGIRLAAFGDVGWAGSRSAFRDGKPLLGSGVGASILDGLIRLDLARGLRAPKGWRFDLYFDGRL